LRPLFRNAFRNLEEIALAKGERWTVEEELFLRKSWGSVPIKEIAARLGRSNGGINSRAARLGLLPGLTQASETSVTPSSHFSPVDKGRSRIDGVAMKRGDLFEGYVRRMFPAPSFTIMLASEGRGSKVPDFYIKYNPPGYKFWVEARYRKAVDDDGMVRIFGDRPDCLNLLHAFQAIVLPETVFVILGLGGYPDAPCDLFRIPVRDIRYSSLKFDHFNKDWKCGRSFSKYVDYTLL